MKTMIIGLSPEYNYPGSFEKWSSNNTYYASNHGASYICRALLRQFYADYIDDFSDIPALRNQYVCACLLFPRTSTEIEIYPIWQILLRNWK